ncbi:cytochrome P450 78A7-like [Apium graveolens]|uniref:cytochrome P450 78A7-like n=1 Tax=Apium graveolens TaxID=4045 RepID=UPI003D7ADA77
MDSSSLLSKDTTWCLFALPVFLSSNNLLEPFVLFSLFVTLITVSVLAWAFSSGGVAWKNGRNRLGPVPIPGLKGLPVLGSILSLSKGLPHRSLASIASARAGLSKQLMAFSLGSSPLVVTSDPVVAREILSSPHFADRPVKQSAKSLLFTRTIGFSPNGAYWRNLRKIASTHLFAPRRIAAHEAGRQLDSAALIRGIASEQATRGVVTLRKHLQDAALNNIMGSVFGRRFDTEKDDKEVNKLREMVAEGFELLSAFNWCDYLPWLSCVYDPQHVIKRCEALVPRVREFVGTIIQQHKLNHNHQSSYAADDADFVDVLLSLDGEDKLSQEDMIAVLWEMIFRGTDTTALLTEWVMAELVLHQDIQTKLNNEICNVVRNKVVTDADVVKLPYLQAVVKETLRIHPPGPLLSWARLSSSDVQLSNGMVVPANTTALVNMWAITHDSELWEAPLEFKPERFLGDGDVDVRGGDLKLAPFGSGRRVCPGKNLGLVTVNMWVAQLVKNYKWAQDVTKNPVDLTEVLKLSCEMRTPLSAIAIPRKIVD